MSFPPSFWISLVVGFLVLALEAAALLQNRIVARSMPRQAGWLRIYRWRYVFGIALAVASMFVSYPCSFHGDRFKVLGLPFVIMLLDQAGKDYVGALTFPSLATDVIAWLLIPDLLLWVWAKRIARPAEA